MATLQTTNDFREAVRHLQSINHFGDVILQVNIGDTVAECEVLDDDTLTILTPDTATLEAALDSANAASAVEQQLQSAAAVAVAQGKEYLKRQLLNPAPDVQVIFNTLSEAINNNPYLLQMFTNQRNLTLAANGWAALDTGTAQGRVRYILIAEQVIALLG